MGLHDGRSIVASESTIDVRAHAERLAPSVNEVLRRVGATPDDVTHVVGGTGPGPFTGLRVGLVTAQVFAWSVGLTAAGVCSLDALAHRVLLDGSVEEGQEFLVATDARRKEVYWATYRVLSGVVERQEGPAVTRPSELPDEVTALPCAGRGPLLYPEILRQGWDVLDVDGGAMSDLAVRRLQTGQVLGPADPDYLRRPDAVPAQAKPVIPVGR